MTSFSLRGGLSCHAFTPTRICFGVFSIGVWAALAVLAGGSISRAAEAGKPLEVLYITGGCCHDYDGQKKVITQGLASRAKINCTVIHEGGTTTDHKVSIYSKPDWSKGYDVVFHNECFAGLKDP